MPPPSPSTAPTRPAPTDVSNTATKNVVGAKAGLSPPVDEHEPAIEPLQHLAGVQQVPRMEEADVADPPGALVVASEDAIRDVTGDVTVRHESFAYDRVPHGLGLFIARCIASDP